MVLRSFSFSYVLGTHTHTHTHTHTPTFTHTLSHTHSGISYGPCRCQWVLGTCTRRPWLWALPPRSFRLIDAGHQLHRSRALDSADKLLLSLNNGCLHVVGGPGTWPRRRQRVLSSLTTLPPLFLLDYLHGVILTPVARTPCACMPWRRQRQRHRCSRKINSRSALWPRGQGALGVSVAQGAAPLCARRRGFPRAALHAWCPHR